MGLLDQLTARQCEIYKFIRNQIRTRGYGPTVRELGDAFDIASPNGVVCHLRALAKKGLIRREPHQSRAIQLTAEPVHSSGLPLAGVIADGVLDQSGERDERVDFHEMFDPDKNLSVLQVRGGSKVGDDIADGDCIIVRQQRTARKGQVVVVAMPNGDVVVRRWIPEKNRIRLESIRSTAKPIHLKEAKVLGSVVGVVRKMK